MNLIGDMNFFIECLVKIAASSLFGALLGLERKYRFQVVGMRTLVLISVSSTLLSILSYYLPEIQTAKGFDGGDPTRIIAGVTSGIGFLGGGAIIHQGLNIKGLTSAAVIWTASALGMAIGVGLYAQSAIVLVVALFMLVFLEKIEEKFFPAGRSKTLHIVYNDENADLVKVKSIIEHHGFKVTDLNMSRIMESNQIILRYTVKAPIKDEFADVIEALKEVNGLSEFSMTD